MSIERRKLLQGYGAEIVLTVLRNVSAMKKADELAKISPLLSCRHSLIIRPMPLPTRKRRVRNLGSHRWASGRIYRWCRNRRYDHRCGTVFKTTTGRHTSFVVEPAGSPVISGGKPGSHMIQTSVLVSCRVLVGQPTMK